MIKQLDSTRFQESREMGVIDVALAVGIGVAQLVEGDQRKRMEGEKRHGKLSYRLRQCAGTFPKVRLRPPKPKRKPSALKPGASGFTSFVAIMPYCQVLRFAKICDFHVFFIWCLFSFAGFEGLDDPG